MKCSAGRRQKKKSRRRADIFSRAHFIPAALIFRAVDFFVFGTTCVLQHYQSYIAHLSMTKIRDESS